MGWSNAKLTNKGREISAKAFARQMTIEIIEIWGATGTVSDSSATDLVGKSIKVGLEGVRQEGANCIVTYQFTNTGVTNNIVLHEVGVYVRDTDGRSVLFAYLTDDAPSTIPKHDPQNPSFVMTMDTVFGFSDASQVTLTPTIKIGLSALEVKAAIDTHNNSPASHNLNKYAGGTATPSVTNWNDLKQPGIYEGNARVFGWANAPSQANVYPYGTIHVHVTDGNVLTQTFYSHGQGKPCKVATRTFYNAWSDWHYMADYDSAKNSIVSARMGMHQLEFTKAGGAKEFVNLLTSNKSDSNTGLAPTLALVKALIGDVNVVDMLKGKGVKYDFSNPNAWYICLGEAFGNLIIQGGTFSLNDQGRTTITFPIAFKNTNYKCYLTPIIYNGNLDVWSIGQILSTKRSNSIDVVGKFLNHNMATGGSFDWMVVGKMQ